MISRVKRWNPSLSVLLGAAFMLIVAGCSTGTIDRSKRFDAASGDTLVVMGVRSTKDYWVDYEITWWPYDAASRSFVGPDSSAITVRRAAEETYSDIELTDMRYLVFQVRPGSYALHSTALKVSDEFRNSYRPRAPGFTAGAGEILYIGDFTFEVPEISFANNARELKDTKFAASGRDDAAAQAALDRYPNVKGSLVYRPIEVVGVE